MELGGAKPKVSRNQKSDFKKGAFCRIMVGDSNVEAVISGEAADECFSITTIGFGEEKTVPAKDILPSLGKAVREAQEMAAAVVKNWVVGDFCRAKWSEDGVIYEGTISSLGTHDEKKYAIVQFLGYGNEDSVWMDELMISRGAEARAHQEKEAGVGDVPPVEPPTSPALTKEWKQNARCRAICKTFGQEYEGTIAKIDADESLAVVHFIGIGVDEEMPLSELKPSAGKEARALQRANNSLPNWEVGMACRAAATDAQEERECDIIEIGTTDDQRYAVVRFVGYGQEESIWLTDLKPSAGSEAREKQLAESGKDSMKAVVAASWVVGDSCRAVFSEDGLEYEGTILEINSTDDGKPFALIKYIGYGNEETKWLEELMESLGKAARDEQTLAAGQPLETVPEVLPKEHSDVGPSKESKKWSVGDACRAIFTDDGVEYEGDIISLGSSEGADYAIVRYVGFNNEESQWLADILPSQGKDAREAQMKAADVSDSSSKAPEIIPEVPESSKAPEVTREVPESSKAPEVTPEVPKSKLVAEVPTSTMKPKAELPAYVASTLPTEKNRPSVFSWNLQDHCSAICKFDGQNHEIVITEFHPSKPLVRGEIVGFGQSEIFKIVDLLPCEAPVADPAPAEKPVQKIVVSSAEPVVLASLSQKNSVVYPKTEAKVSQAENPNVQATQPPGEAMTMDSNNNQVIHLCEVATRLAKELDSIPVIAELRKKLEMKDNEVKLLEDRNSVNEIIIQEMRETNIQLRAANERYKINEKGFQTKSTEQLNIITTLLQKVDQLKRKNAALVDEILNIKAARL